MRPHKLLLVEDEEAALFGYERYLTKNGYTVKGAGTLAEARGAIAADRFDAIVLDLKLPDGRIFANAVVAGGIRIGEGSTIGALAFINRDVPPHSVALTERTICKAAGENEEDER